MDQRGCIINERVEDQCRSNRPPIPVQVQIDDSPVYRIERKLGKGGFGQVYVGRAIISSTSSNETSVESPEVAVKFEHRDSRGCEGGIPNEWKVYEDLGENHGIPLPRVHYKGQQGDYYVVVMDLLGQTLRNTFRHNIPILPLEAIACIAVEAIFILEKLHSRGYIHGDITPGNFLLGPRGTPDKKRLFLTNLRLATRWRDPLTGSHVKYNQTPDDFRGTVRFASVHTQLGRTSSRRNDLESLVYVLVYLISGRLPWQRHQGEAYLVCKQKMATPPDMLCDCCPKPYLQFTEFVLDLKFDEEPNYAKYISLFRGIIGQNTYVWPVHIDVTQEVPCKQARSKDDDELPKRTRMWSKSKQWITVYDVHPPMKQRCFANLDAVDLVFHIHNGRAEGMRVVSLACSPHPKQWTIIMDDSARYTAQNYTFSLGNLPKDWIQAHWLQGYSITAVAGADDGRFLVTMSKGTQIVRQSYCVATTFPFKWIKENWAEGFYVTTMATSGSLWAVVSSNGTEFTDQVVELDFQYPAEGIRERSKQGYYITSVAATPDQVAFIFSIPGGVPATARVEQEILQTYNFPVGHKIKEMQARNYYISSLCYGRSVS